MVKVPPPLLALFYLAIAAAISALAGWPRPLGLPLFPLGLVLLVAGVALAASAALQFRRVGVTFHSEATEHTALVVSGPFRFTRNPMYLGLILASLGIAVWNGAWPMFLAPIATALTASLVHIPFEEAAMRREFGEAFEDYARRVRRWI